MAVPIVCSSSGDHGIRRTVYPMHRLEVPEFDMVSPELPVALVIEEVHYGS